LIGSTSRKVGYDYGCIYDGNNEPMEMLIETIIGTKIDFLTIFFDTEIEIF
jgi:hypothetical protein